MNEQYLLLYLPDVLVHVARGGSHVLLAWHWLWGLPSRVYPSLHSKVTLSLYRNSWLMSNFFQIPLVNSGRLHFTSEIRKIRRKLINLVITTIIERPMTHKPIFPSAKMGHVYSQEKLITPP